MNFSQLADEIKTRQKPMSTVSGYPVGYRFTLYWNGELHHNVVVMPGNQWDLYLAGKLESGDEPDLFLSAIFST